MKQRAKQLRDQGNSYASIARILGFSVLTIYFWLNPEAEERNRVASRRRGADRLTIVKERCRLALRRSRDKARKRGHLPCNATYSELIRSLNGRCHICRAEEKDLPKRLAIDHDHTTGDFRGWLCDRCNRNVERFSDAHPLAERAARYLKGELNPFLHVTKYVTN